MITVGLDKKRLRWIRGVMALVFAVLLVRLFHVQIIRHEAYLAKGRIQWLSRVSVPAERGNIYDRNGKSLALSVTTWRLGIATKRVTDPAATAAKLLGVVDLSPEQIIRRIREADGAHIVLEREAVLHGAVLKRLEMATEITAERLNTRIYPFDGCGASLIGFVNGEGEDRFLTGLEKSYDDVLRGQSGDGWHHDTARNGGSAGLEIIRHPVDGRDIFLTIDADLQSICEDFLVEAVLETNSSGGLVLIADPKTGEVLAAANSPVIHSRVREGGDPSVWSNTNFTSHYEPGSIFKIFTTSSLLKRAVIDTATVFDCDDDRFDGYRIRNSEGHDFGNMSLMDAFAQSSNVYFARAALNLTREEFHRDLVEFGFGAPTNIRYPGKALGLLKPPRKWSKRTLSTMAIGQEMAATPLQLVTAAGVVANGGKLMSAQLVRQIRDKNHRLLMDFTPVVQREVLTRQQADLVRQAMVNVVTRGTGRSADAGWISSAGKTGTAQKAVPGEGYKPGLYMSSYLGMVPAEEPRLVILTMLDEPDYTHHYAAQSAAPLFRAIVTEIGRSTGWLHCAGQEAGQLCIDTDKEKLHVVPDIMYLNRQQAERVLHKAGLEAELQGDGYLVVAQSPPSGASVTGGTKISLVLTEPGVDKGAGQACPNLVGLSMRQLRRTCAMMGIEFDANGIGYVKSQMPRPGVPLSAEGVQVTLEM